MTTDQERDLRQRYAEALHYVIYGPHSGSTTQRLAATAAHAVLAVRDDELAALRRDLDAAQKAGRRAEGSENYVSKCLAAQDNRVRGLQGEVAKQRERAEQAKSQVTRVREWAERMRRTGNPDGMGAHIHATVTRLLDQPATEETDHA